MLLRIHCSEQTNGGGRLVWQVITVVKVRGGGSNQGKSSGGGEKWSGSRLTFLTN